MSTPPGPVGFVLGSSARRDVVSWLADGSRDGRALVDASATSESAVYDALNRLGERGLVEEVDGEWHLTGSGRLVADAIERLDRLDGVIESDAEYWSNHDPTGLPNGLRRDLYLLDDCEVIRSPETDPYRAARSVERAIERADEIAIVGATYNDRHAEALLDSEADRRLLMVPGMVERLLRDDPDGPDDDGIEEIEIRVATADVSLTLTDREVLFSLPRCAGGFDTTTEVRSETDAAIEWGRRVFEYYWSDAVPVEAWIAENMPEYAEGDAESRHTPRSFRE